MGLPLEYSNHIAGIRTEWMIVFKDSPNQAVDFYLPNPFNNKTLIKVIKGKPSIQICEYIHRECDKLRNECLNLSKDIMQEPSIPSQINKLNKTMTGIFELLKFFNRIMKKIDPLNPPDQKIDKPPV